MAKARNEGIFTPPVVDRTQISVPGAHGSGNWGAAAGDPAAGMVYVTRVERTRHPRVVRERGLPLGKPGPPGAALLLADVLRVSTGGSSQPPCARECSGRLHQDNRAQRQGTNAGNSESTLSTGEPRHDYFVPGESGRRRTGTHPAGTPRPARPPAPPGQTRYWGPYGNPWTLSGMPAIAPPWTELVAYDLNQGTIKWRSPLERHSGAFRPRDQEPRECPAEGWTGRDRW